MITTNRSTIRAATWLIPVCLSAGVVIGGCEDRSKSPAAGAGGAGAPAAAVPEAPAGSAAEQGMAAAKEKIAEVSLAAREAFAGYLKELTSVNALLEKVKGPMDISGALPGLTKSATSINGLTETLNQLSPEQRTNLIGGQEGTLSSLVGTFKGHLARLSRDSMTSQVGEILKGFRLFE